MTLSPRLPLVPSLVSTRAPVRVSCQPVAPTRAASIGSGTRSSLATWRSVELIRPIVPVGGLSPLISRRLWDAGHSPQRGVTRVDSLACR